MGKEFNYHSIDTLKEYIRQTILYLDLSGNEKQGTLEGNKRPYVKEIACNAYADTVLICLNNLQSKTLIKSGHGVNW